MTFYEVSAKENINIDELFKNYVYLNVNGTYKYVQLGLKCLQIEMTSPSGTKSVLHHAYSGMGNLSLYESRILTNAFYGEPANGNWKLSFYDYCGSYFGRAVLSSNLGQHWIISGH